MDRGLRPSLAVALVLLVAAPASGASQACAVPGEPIQWIADYCMLRMETDDEIAVSGCIEREGGARPADACASNRHFKRRMCNMMIRNGTRKGSREQCVNDPAFRGRTVEAGGVGGRQ